MNQYKYLLLICLGLLFACEKEIKPPTDEDKGPPIDEEDERIKERIYYYYNQQSFWTDNIPDRNEEERKAFVKNYTSNGALLNALKGLTPFHSGYGGSIDRFSFLDESDADGNLSYADGFRMDTNDGYGLYYGWGILSPSATKAYPVIYFVEGGSPAQKRGVTRGSIVYALNDEEDITVGYNGVALNETDRRRVTAKLDAAMEARTLKLTVETVDGEETEYTLNYETYDINPIVADTVYEYSRNVGYLAYSSFEETDTRSATGRKNRQDLEDVFASFENADINDLILDLRYNTGGYVEAAEYLADKLVGVSGDGELMFSYEVNDYLASAPLYRNNFQDVKFSRKNNLELNNVYILVTQSTASAAELLISSLKPYLNIALIAEENRTFGKPVGFFPQNITDDVTLWVTSFKTINADGYSDYWDGMAVDIPNIDDYIFKDFGDPTEDMIAEALDLAGVSATSMRASSRKSSSAQRGVKLGIINQPRERNMLKTKED